MYIYPRLLVEKAIITENMKKLIYIIGCLLLFCGCVFTYDPAPGRLYIRNNSDEAVYVYLKCGETDILPSEPKLELLEFFNNEDGSMKDTLDNPLKSSFVFPEYRISANHLGFLLIGGNSKKPRLLCKENKITLFFIMEKTMHSYDWKEIHRNQIFAQKRTLTKEELENNNWEVIYP